MKYFNYEAKKKHMHKQPLADENVDLKYIIVLYFHSISFASLLS